MTTEKIQEYKDSIDGAVALLTEFRTALDNPRTVSSRCAYCHEIFAEVESGECPPALLEHAKTCSKSPPAKEIKRLRVSLRNLYNDCRNEPCDKQRGTVMDEARKALEGKK